MMSSLENDTAVRPAKRVPNPVTPVLSIRNSFIPPGLATSVDVAANLVRSKCRGPTKWRHQVNQEDSHQFRLHQGSYTPNCSSQVSIKCKLTNGNAISTPNPQHVVPSILYEALGTTSDTSGGCSGYGRDTRGPYLSNCQHGGRSLARNVEQKAPLTDQETSRIPRRFTLQILFCSKSVQRPTTV